MFSVRTIQDAENEINFLNANPYHHHQHQPQYNAFLPFNNTNTNIGIANMLKFKKKIFTNNTNMSIQNTYPYKSVKDIEIQLLSNRSPSAAGHLGRPPPRTRPIPSNYVSHFR